MIAVQRDSLISLPFPPEDNFPRNILSCQLALHEANVFSKELEIFDGMRGAFACVPHLVLELSLDLFYLGKVIN